MSSITDQVWMGLVYVWTQIDKVILGAAATAFVVASLRMHKNGNYRLVEALLCGIMCYITLIGFEVIAPALIGMLHGMGITVAFPAAVSTGLAQVTAGVIGWYGVDRTVAFLESKLSGGKPNDTDQS